MTCPELVDRRVKPTTVDTGRYRRLHNDGRRLIHGWFERAWKRRNCSAEESFEPFIFSWIAFNAWATCVTDLDDDREWRWALMLDQTICSCFDELVKGGQLAAAGHAQEFHNLWPIFKAQELRREQLLYCGQEDDRSRRAAFYLQQGVRSFEPQCWKRHEVNNEEVPLDWPHTLAALNRVRCNLFHGEKARHSEMDRDIVHSALRVLVYFLSESGYLGSPP